MPQGLLTKNYIKLDTAFKKGYTTASEQGSARSSKTYSNVQWLINLCSTTAGMTVSIVRKTMPAIKRSVYRDFEEIMVDWGLWNTGKMNKSEYVYTFPNGSWIEFFSCENEQKLRGPKRKILFVNEANELTPLEWQQLQMRTTLFTIIDYNPSFSDEHWINFVNKEKKTFHWISTYKDNPFLEQRVVEEIEKLRTSNSSLWQVYGLGMQAIVEGLIFTNVEVINSIPAHVKKHHWRGIDFGYSSDPTAIVDVFYHDRNLYLDEICYNTAMLSSDIIRTLKENDGSVETICESADPRLIQEIYRGGCNVRQVHKFGGSILAGISKMQESPKIYITSRSVNGIKEFKNYTWAQDKEGHWLNKPIDAFNHFIDAVRYVCLEKILGGQRKPVNLTKLSNIAY